MAKQEIETRNPISKSSIPYIRCYEELGLIETSKNVYTRTYKLTPANEKTHQIYHFQYAKKCMEQILGRISEDYSFQFTMRNSRVDQKEFLSKIVLKADKEPEVNDCINLYNKVLIENSEIGHNNYRRETYLTLITVEGTTEDAVASFASIHDFIINGFRQLYKYEAKALVLEERLKLLYEIYHPDGELNKFGSNIALDEKNFSIQAMRSKKKSTKDVIAPTNYELGHRDFMRVGNQYVRNFFINSIPITVSNTCGVNRNGLLGAFYAYRQSLAQPICESIVTGISIETYHSHSRCADAGSTSAP